ncbi:hypothetical protein C8Q74DRAFT_1363746 [Fomes fomentarius]|nr:hypothetical protein C8Q74DRAFT_1363746 [Fomes fomentarius]
MFQRIARDSRFLAGSYESKIKSVHLCAALQGHEPPGRRKREVQEDSASVQVRSRLIQDEATEKSSELQELENAKSTSNLTRIPPAPHSLANQALEAFARFALPDDNRRAIAQVVPQSWPWIMFEALVHRLPVTDHDFHLKYRAKRDGTLDFSEAMLKLRYCTPPMESRQTFAGLIHWVIEQLKVVESTSIPR